MKRSLNSINAVSTSHDVGLKRVLLGANESGCSLTQIAVTDLKAGEVAQAHIHPDMQEGFYVLEGGLDVKLDDEVLHCTKDDVKMRPPYGKVMERRQRFASFIATTNNLRPLTDPTGSRRFICVYAETIDNKGRIAHNQIFAQLLHELKAGQRYWFTDKENERIMAENARFQQVNDYQTMIELTFLPAEETSEGAAYVSLTEVIKLFSHAFPTFVTTKNTRKELGSVFRSMGYLPKKGNKGMSYLLEKL